MAKPDDGQAHAEVEGEYMDVSKEHGISERTVENGVGGQRRQPGTVRN
jgi:hypothetical protein